MKLSEEDIRMLQYFWEEKGDIEKWAGFERMRPAIEEQFPELIKAWSDYKASVRIMDAVIKNIEAE